MSTDVSKNPTVFSPLVINDHTVELVHQFKYCLYSHGIIVFKLSSSSILYLHCPVGIQATTQNRLQMTKFMFWFVCFLLTQQKLRSQFCRKWQTSERKPVTWVRLWLYKYQFCRRMRDLVKPVQSTFRKIFNLPKNQQSNKPMRSPSIHRILTSCQLLWVGCLSFYE